MVKSSSIDRLQEIAKEVASCRSVTGKMGALAEAFELFSKETIRLEDAYNQLKEQFEFVNRKLEEINIELKEKVLELDVTTDYLDNILSNMSQGLLFISSTGIVTTYNTAAETILEIPSSKVLFQPFSDSFEDDIFGFSIKQALESGDTSRHLSIKLPAKGERSVEREIEVEATFVLKNNRKEKNSSSDHLDIAMGIIVLIRDITEIRRLQLVASRNDRMKELGEMAAMVAHEIRNPLGGIKGFASLLVRDLKDYPQWQKMASSIVDGTDNLSKLVTNILNYSRPLQIEYRTVNLGNLMQDIVHHVRVDSMMKDNIKIYFEPPVEPVEVKLDQRMIKSSLLNVIVNSVQAMPNGGNITLSLAKENPFVIIKVQDTGEGISKEHLEKIFRPFFTTKPQGHGFGLAEVHRVLQAHNGTIEVDSTVGKGSTFTFKIPVT